MYDLTYLKEKAAQIRYDCVEAIYYAKSGHPGGSLSAAEMMVALYYYKMNIDVSNPEMENRDRFIMSKGHACPVLYAILADKGYFPKEELKKLRRIDSILQGAPNKNYTPGIDMSAGSLGQGLSVAAGMAMAGKMDNKDYTVYTMMGDGEMQEGQVWEAMMFAAQFKLDNMVAILDNNHVQMCGRNAEIMDIGDMAEKFRDFGWNVHCVDGHNFDEIITALDGMKRNGKPTAIVSETIKGKGISYMEGLAKWHGGCPTEEQLAIAKQELLGGVL